MSKSEKEGRTLQRRRMRAGRLLLRGVPQAEVARRVAVTRTTVSTWNEQLESGGLPALKRRPRGRPSGLEAQQKIELVRLLKEGALAQGFATELWTLRRVGQLIQEKFGRRYSESQVWRILIGLGFSSQRRRMVLGIHEGAQARYGRWCRKAEAALGGPAARAPGAVTITVRKPSSSTISVIPLPRRPSQSESVSKSSSDN